MKRVLRFVLIASFAMFFVPHAAHAQLSLTSGNNATTTPNVATAITGFQIVGAAASTTPVKLFTTSGTLSMLTTTGLTFTGSPTGSTVYFSGTVANINAALSTLRYSRSSTGTDTLEVSLVNPGEVFFTGNNHLYKFISGSYTWSAAKTAAEGLTAYGAAGYLATITSSQENTFISGRLTGDGWFGASDSQVEGTWKWMTGPEAGTTFWQGTSGGSTVGGNYANWASGEPNQSGEEDCAQTYVASGNWNDLPCSSGLGYVVEFGAPGNMPTVVAKNISIVTADVPAVTSLSPSNGASSVLPSANLVIGFSKSVSTSTGNIIIRKASDNSIAKSIDVTSSQVSGGGTNTITINPTTDLDELTSYYVTVPSTAFKDASNNFFDGISASSTWAFTTTDVTAPVISNIASSSVASTSASITWDTNELASTRLVFSVGESFSSSTAQTDTSPRVLSHSVSLSGLLSCTTYNYKAVSVDGYTNTATSSPYAFTTLGCPAGVTPVTSTTTQVSSNTTGTSTLSEEGRTLTVTTPPNFTATSSTVLIQIKSIEADPVLGNLGMPTEMSKATNVVFDVTALINSSQVLDSFDAPVTVTYTYTDEDIEGIDENTLWMYHFHSGAWVRLDACALNKETNTISCTTPSFSIFSIFGQPPVVRDTGPSMISAATTYGCTDPKAENYQRLFVASNMALCKYSAINTPVTVSTSASTSTQSMVFTRNLSVGMSGDDVRALQQILNKKGFTISVSGPGSIGNETNMFGGKTRQALIKYQKQYGIKPAIGYFGPITRTHIAGN